jgi:hypothetical protein
MRQVNAAQVYVCRSGLAMGESVYGRATFHAQPLSFGTQLALTSLQDSQASDLPVLGGSEHSTCVD